MTLRIGFVGTGGIAQVHLGNVAQSTVAEVVAICDISQNALEQTKQKFGGASYTDYQKMLENEKLDAVFICVPPFAHGDVEEQVAKRGIHLFVEKPLGLDLETVRQKAKVIEESEIITSTGYCLRYLDAVQKARQYLESRDIAMVVGYYHTGFVAAPWWRTKSKSGGQLVEQTTHIVDLVRFLGGEVDSVFANQALRVSQDIPDLDIDDVGVVNLQMSSGAVGVVTSTFTQPDHHSGVQVLGKGFRLSYEGSTVNCLEKSESCVWDSSVDPYQAQDSAFLQALKTGDRTGILAPYEEAMRTLEVTLAANESAARRQPVALRS